MKEINAKNKAVLLVSDLHFPYTHRDSLKFLDAVSNEYCPDIILSAGDEVDGHAISFHDSDSSLFNADKELEVALKHIEGLHKLFPKMFLCESNHGSLITRRLKSQGLPIRHLMPMAELYSTPKWEWFDDFLLTTRQNLPVYICHGKTGAYNKLAKEQGCSAIQGHFHGKFEITWAKSNIYERFNMFIGCLIDYQSRAFAYGKNNLPKPILGCGFLDKEGIPQLIKMGLKSNGRWDGRV